SEIIKNIKVEGNVRISSETINVFSQVSINDNLESSEINDVLKKIYLTGYFENVNVEFNEGILFIKVIENPIIQNIIYDGIKAQKIKDIITKNLNLRERSPFNEIYLSADKDKIIESLKSAGYFFAKVEIFKEVFEDNKIDIIYKIDIGDKAKIKKISFLGNKVFKDNKLKRLIISEEYKFWKIISGKKYLNTDIVLLDARLLRNYYLNKGYYDTKINSSFAKLVNDDGFELIFNINAGKKIFFNDLKLNLPVDFEKNNFIELENIFKNNKNEPYSLYTIQKIIEKLEEITLNEEYRSINASINEEILDDKINITFNIEKTNDTYVEKINIFGNSITHESVIRNRFFLDEGDPYNEILKNKTINEIKSLNFFKNVDVDVLEGQNDYSKVLNITVEEKPTGEIAAIAGVGTSGNTIGFSVRENNFLGKGIGLNSNLTLSADSIDGLLSVTNPNVFNSDKSITTSLESSELDKFSDYGYKTSKTGFLISTNFEYLDDFRLGIGNSNYYQNIETDSTASEAQKKQRGDYWDSYLKLDFDYDKRNQKFQTNSGFRSFYSLDIPIISDTNTLINSYNFQNYVELYENNITTFSLYLNSVNSITGNDVKLSERLYIPSSKLRGFKFGAVGPKSGSDYVGGNYVGAINLITTLPQLLENSQNIDFSVFFDTANVWGVDYDSSINDSNELRSSFGIALDWLTPIGPLNFSLSQPITKSSTDQVETFRFNLGTTF
ncbi:MAG: outer membrane protein assembly factor BamA, partial [Pelagibacteraceae bacterium BACL5 MAG-121015-bin10]